MLTIHINDSLERKIEEIAAHLKIKKNELVEKALKKYIAELESTKEKRIIEALKKTKDADMKLYKELEGTLDDGI